MQKTITEFQGEYRFLSNFWNTPITYNSIDYLNAEAAYQAQKSPKNAHLFTQLNGYEAKKMGYKVLMVANWNDTKRQIMYNIVSEKFRQNADLRDKLLATGDAIILEGNKWHDTYWGVCDGVGENWLGRILMRVRNELRAELTQK